MELGIHVGEGRQIDDAAPAQVLPDAAGDENGAEILGLRQEGDSIRPEEHPGLIENAVNPAEVLDNADDNYG